MGVSTMLFILFLYLLASLTALVGVMVGRIKGFWAGCWGVSVGVFLYVMVVRYMNAHSPLLFTPFDSLVDALGLRNSQDDVRIIVPILVVSMIFGLISGAMLETGKRVSKLLRG